MSPGMSNIFMHVCMKIFHLLLNAVLTATTEYEKLIFKAFLSDETKAQRYKGTYE